MQGFLLLKWFRLGPVGITFQRSSRDFLSRHRYVGLFLMLNGFCFIRPNCSGEKPKNVNVGYSNERIAKEISVWQSGGGRDADLALLTGFSRTGVHDRKRITGRAGS